MHKTIYLVGFMGAGKSHVGRKLAASLYCPFVDLDHQIEAAAKLTISTIFAQHGEQYFRLLERRALHDTTFGPTRVVATGGGAPCFFNNMDWMNQSGLVIYLDANPEVLLERLWRARVKRPLLNGLDKGEMLTFIKKKIESRNAFYSKAPIRYQITNEKSDTATALLNSLSQITGH